MTKKKLLATLLTGAIVATMFMGCSGNKDKEAGASGSGTELTIWTKLPEQEVPVLKDAADKWAKETGNKVKVVRDDGDFQAFLQAANSTKGPDIYFGSAHNQLAAYQQAGVLTEVPAKYVKEDEYASKSVWDAVSVDNKKYAIPISVETTALFYNKDLVKEAPKTMNDLVNEALKKGNGAFQFNINDQYTDLGFLLTNGGYIFGKKDGKYDTNDIGLNNEGSVKGLQMLQDFVVKDKFMPADISGDIALTNFKEGKSMFYISGPWDIQGLKDAKLNFGVSKIPSIDGKEFTPMSGVQCAFVSSKSKNIDLSWECLDYLVKETQEGLYEKENSSN
ncbi:maltose ABC transporter substrate-binding protein [Clostridium perfringens]|nr:maltose ABC transporter substrate-binding protein [Clostridium perfringens]